MKKSIIIILFVIFQVMIALLLTSCRESYVNSKETNNFNICIIDTDTLKTSCGLKPPMTFLTLMQRNDNIRVSENYNNSNFIMFNSLNKIDSALPKLVVPLNARYIFAIHGMDAVASKATFVTTMKGSKYIPVSFDLTKQSDLQSMMQDIHPRQRYILKKNLQQQKGLKIVSSKEEAFATFKNDREYVVCQELLLNPLVVSKRKVNIRIYLCVKISNGVAKFSMFEDGFMYYAQQPWNSNSMSTDVHVTTGLMKDRSIYDHSPLTFKDLIKHLGPRGQILHSNIKNALKEVKNRYQPLLEKLNKDLSKHRTCFTIFGVDIAPDSVLNIKIMEINKGPDLTFKDQRDADLKLSLISSLLDDIKGKEVETWIGL